MKLYLFITILSLIAGEAIGNPNGILEIKGFTAGGGYSSSQSEAISTARSICNRLFIAAADAFGRFRMVKNAVRSQECGEPVNESPFGSGFLYVYRPVVHLRVDPEDKILTVDGAEIKGEEAPQHALHFAYSSYTEACFSQIQKLRADHGTKFVAAACGESKASVRMSYSADHGRDMPNLTVSSKMTVYLRENDPGRPADYRDLSIRRNFSLGLVDLVQSLGSSSQDSPFILTTHFAGNVAKIDLVTKNIVWERNLTNPSPGDVRMTTSLNAVDVTNDDKQVAVGGDNGYLAVLNGETGEKIRLLSCDPEMFLPRHYVSVKIDAQNRYLFSVAHLADTPSHSTGYNRMAFPHENRTPSSFQLDLWNFESGAKIWSAPFRSQEVLRVGFSKDTGFAYVIAMDKISIYQAADGSLVKEFTLSSYEGDLEGSLISGANFSDDMRFLAISAFSGVILINTESGKMVDRFRADFKYELGNPEISLSGERLRAFDAWGHVFEWDLSSGALMGAGHDERVSLSYNGPLNIPMMSLQNGRFFVYSSPRTSGGTGITLPRIEPLPGFGQLCKVGPGSELPPLTIRPLATLQVWSVD